MSTGPYSFHQNSKYYNLPQWLVKIEAMKAISVAGSMVSIQIACLVQYVQSVILSKVIFLSQIHVRHHKNTQKVGRKHGKFSFPGYNKTELSLEMLFGCNAVSDINLWKWRSPAKSSLFHFNTKVTVLWPFCVIFHMILPCRMQKCDIWKESPVWLNW